MRKDMMQCMTMMVSSSRPSEQALEEEAQTK